MIGNHAWSTRSSTGLLAAAVLAFLSSSPALAGGLVIVSTAVSDNGDGDGFADTNETVQLTIDVENTSGGELTGVTARLVTETPDLVCITTSEVALGDIADGASAQSPPFVFHVLDVDRSAMGLDGYDYLPAAFKVLFSTTNAGNPRAVVPRIDLDLDLDISAGSGSTTFFDTFEDPVAEPFGTFEADNMDAGHFGLLGSNGFRCSYSDPDWVNGNSHDNIFTDECHLGASVAHADAEFWGISGPAFSPLGGRAFTGFHSMFFGVDLGPPKNWTTPMATLEAVRSSDPIHLDWSGAPPELSIKHQASVTDDRCASVPPVTNYDQTVVMAQFADDAGAAVGPWIKLYPHRNVYDTQNATNIGNCSFDPIDDGNTEDDFFDPTDPARRFGPSSTCWPEWVYSNVGETSNPYDPANVGRVEGPGLAGQWGIGTWIESRFDLGRFRGRSVRLRFLASIIASPNPPDAETWEDTFQFNPEPCDDGWWVDDVTVTRSLTTAAGVAADTTDNSGLPGPSSADADSDGIFDVCDNCAVAGNADQRDQDLDGLGDLCDPCKTEVGNVDLDGDQVCGTDNCPLVYNPGQADADFDGFGLACDCDDSDPFVYPGAPERNDGMDNQCPGDAGYGVTDEVSGLAGFYDPDDKDAFSWQHQTGASRYEWVRGSSADFTSGCLAQDVPVGQPTVSVGGFLPAGAIRYFLVRAKQPMLGSWGQDSAGQERSIPCSP